MGTFLCGGDGGRVVQEVSVLNDFSECSCCIFTLLYFPYHSKLSASSFSCLLITDSRPYSTVFLSRRV